MTSLPLTLAADMPPLPEGPFFHATDVADVSDWAFWFITWLCVFFFVLIVGLMFWFMWKYRRRSHVANTEGPTHHTFLEVTWTVIPLILVIAIFWIGARGYIQMRVAPLGAYEVSVTGQRWFWSFKHPNGAQVENVLHVPQGQAVKLNMQSSDVLHSFYVPAFRVKQDVVPGRITMLWFEPKFAGRYDLYCAEYCGTSHSQMVGRVEVLPEAEFEAEIARQAAWMDKISDEDLWWAAGPRIYAQCAACHSVDGSPGTGPTWKGLWTKLAAEAEKFTDGTTLADQIAKGVYKSPEDYVQQSMWFPNQHIVQGFSGGMPTFKGLLNDRAVHAITEYMKQLSKDPDNFMKDGKLKKTPEPTPAPGPQAAAR